jgi:colanic acid/amylovoran biosynthesis glycosyltransferase
LAVTGPDSAVRVLVVGSQNPPQTFLQRLFEGLAHSGQHVRLATSTRPDPSWAGPAGIGWVPTRPPAAVGVPQRALARVRHRDALPHDVARLTRWISAHRDEIDVVYFPWNEAAITHRPLLDLGIPVVISCRGSQVAVAPWNPERRAIRLGLAETFERATAVHCVSHAMLEEAVALGLDRSRATVITPAVDADVFTQGAARRGGRSVHLFTTGSLIWRKGQEDAIQAVRIAADHGVDATLGIIGSGDDRDRLLYAAHDLGVADRVTLHGQLGVAAVLDHLQRADAFVLPSVAEGISNAVLEAMACGLPVITTDCGGMAEAVTDGVEGFVVPVRAPERIAAAIGELADPDVRARLGAAARTRVATEFRLADQITAFAALLRAARSRS